MSHIPAVAEAYPVEAEVDQLLQRCQNFPVLGFDIETNTNSVKKADIMQLASVDGYCVIFQIARMDSIPQKLVDLMGNPKILKVGVSVEEDVKILVAKHGMTVRGSFDVRILAIDCGVKTKLNLKDLAGKLAGMHMISYDYIIWKYWDMRDIPNSQKRYAADDAIAGVKIFEELLRLYIEMNDLKIDAKQAIEQHFYNGHYRKFLDASNVNNTILKC